VVPSIAAPEEVVAAAPRRWIGAWLFSRRTDLLILGVPAVATLIAAAVGLSRGGDALGERAYAAWFAQFVLGNTTHVILTYLLLGARRDILHATAGQARTVVVGSLVTYALTFAMLWVTGRTFPAWSELGVAVVAIFATHHTVSQAKGLWSLHNLRGKAVGLPPPGARERSAQQTFVPLALLLIMIRTLFVPKAAGATFPFIQAIPTLEAVLPFAATYGMLAVWLAFSAWALSTIVRGAPRLSGPKLLYVGAHMAGVALTIASPAWGVIFTSGVHGLEYYTLTARMLRPTADEPATRLSRALVVPAMLGIMLPVFVVGLGVAPFTAAIGLGAYASLFGALRMAVNGVVAAHYFADAFIYRFRIPEVRRVALARLGFI
jgi:hypothetical protein